MPGRDRRKVATRLLYLFGAIALGLDQLSKVAVTSLVLFGESARFAGLRITPVQNTGVAFGLLRGYGSILAVVAVLIAALVFAFGRRGVRAVTARASGVRHSERSEESAFSNSVSGKADSSTSLGVTTYLPRVNSYVRAPLAGAALGLLIGGAAGNLVDRLVRGYVFDFIDVGFWPVFNMADCAITVGVGLLILQLIFLERRREL